MRHINSVFYLNENVFLYEWMVCTKYKLKQWKQLQSLFISFIYCGCESVGNITLFFLLTDKGHPAHLGSDQIPL